MHCYKRFTSHKSNATLSLLLRSSHYTAKVNARNAMSRRPANCSWWIPVYLRAKLGRLMFRITQTRIGYVTSYRFYSMLKLDGSFQTSCILIEKGWLILDLNPNKWWLSVTGQPTNCYMHFVTARDSILKGMDDGDEGEFESHPLLLQPRVWWTEGAPCTTHFFCRLLHANQIRPGFDCTSTLWHWQWYWRLIVVLRTMCFILYLWSSMCVFIWFKMLV